MGRTSAQRTPSRSADGSGERAIRREASNREQCEWVLLGAEENPQ